MVQDICVSTPELLSLIPGLGRFFFLPVFTSKVAGLIWIGKSSGQDGLLGQKKSGFLHVDQESNLEVEMARKREV